jgi:hypothetical protein
MRLLTVAVLAALLFGGCGEPEIENSRVGAVKIYTAENSSNSGTIVLTSCSPKDDSLWHETAKKMCILDYRVVVCSPLVLDSISRTTLLGTEAPGYALAGYGKAAATLFALAAGDSMLKALVLINPVFADSAVFSGLSIPVVVVASTKNVNSFERIRKHYEALPKPKKWVELVTDIRDLRIVNTHLEPIVRRVIVMLADRYVKKK